VKQLEKILALVLVVLAGRAPLVAAEKVKESAVQLVVNLTDGSRLIGETTLANLPLRSEALGKLDVPLDRVALIKFSADHESLTVTLQNGDRIQAGIGVTTVALKTAFGAVTVPLEKTTEIQVRHGKASLVEWDILPFPMDSDWPGPRGEPATVDTGEIVIRGQPVCTKQAYSAPLTFECEFTVDQPLTHLEYAAITFTPEGADPCSDPPVGSLDVLLQYEGAGGDGGHLYIQRRGRGVVSLTKEPFVLQAGKPYQLRVEVLSDVLRITLNGQAYEAEGITLPFKAFHIRLYGWKPDKVWHVRNVTVR
jgi:hypothetical protein